MPASRYATATSPISASDFQGGCGGTTSTAAALTCKRFLPDLWPRFSGAVFSFSNPAFGLARRLLRQNERATGFRGIIACALAYHIPKCPPTTLVTKQKRLGRNHDRHRTTDGTA